MFDWTVKENVVYLGACESHRICCRIFSHKRDEEKSVQAPAVVEKVEKRLSTSAVLVDTSKAIKAALEASKTYGKTSVEARMAWEAVEEMDAINARRKAESQ